jgi:hypothetical protein
MDLHLGRFVVQPLAGVYINVGLGDMKFENKDYDESVKYKRDNPLLGVMFGGAAGFRIGKGYLMVDLRYASDLGYVTFDGDEDNGLHRSAFKGNFVYQRYF